MGVSWAGGNGLGKFLGWVFLLIVRVWFGLKLHNDQNCNSTKVEGPDV